MKPTRLARTITTSWSLISRSTALMGRGGPSSWFASSSSSSSSSSPSPSNKSPKTEKKVVDRLSTVIDAVNDRKLPPELRGQRNAVRSSCPSLCYCIMRLDNVEHDAKNGTGDLLAVDPLPVTQWNLLAVCLFFCTGHWCAFDGLRYGAAFIGFDEFVLIRQAILLTIDTFGFSHILPIFGLPFLVTRQHLSSHKRFILVRLSQVYMIYGLITASTVTITMLCVTIHRRHLMVWGLFAPKFVFDVVGLILTDVLICLASLFCFGHAEDDVLHNQSTEKLNE
ncbi:gpi ethanolamine phosphate transferase 3 [Fagus crenata]